MIRKMGALRRAFVAFLFCLLLAPAAGARNIYVRLSQAGSFTVASDGNMTLSGKGKTVTLGTSASLSVTGGNVTVGKTSLALPVHITSTGLLRFNGRQYRGAFMVTQKAGLMNVLNIEQYLCGVLPAEVGADWPEETLRAQAIISRTYALRQSLDRAKKGYDVVDTVNDQVYKDGKDESCRVQHGGYGPGLWQGACLHPLPLRQRRPHGEQRARVGDERSLPHGCRRAHCLHVAGLHLVREGIPRCGGEGCGEDGRGRKHRPYL